MKKGNVKGFIPLLVFIGLYIMTGLVTKSFETVPLMLHLLLTIAFAFSLTNHENKKTFDEKIHVFCKGAGESTILLMILIFILSGAFFGVANAIHAVDAVSNLGLRLLHPNVLLPGMFVISCLLSFSMGTSMGTVAAIAPLGIDIAHKTNMSVALFCGIILGGAMFGDNLSFISDTTIAATKTQHIQMKDKFKTNIAMVFPAVLFNIIFLLMVPIKVLHMPTLSSIEWLPIFPYALVIFLSLIGKHVITVLTSGIVSGVGVGMIQKNVHFTSFVNEMYAGISSMQEIAIISLLIGGLVALMQYLGGIDWLLYRLTHMAKSKRQAECSIAGLVSLMDIATANNTISILTIGPLAREISLKFHLSPTRVASILDLFSSAFNGLLPYSAQLLIISKLSNTSPIHILSYNWYSMMMIGCALISIFIQYPKGKRSKDIGNIF